MDADDNALKVKSYCFELGFFVFYIVCIYGVWGLLHLMFLERPGTLRDGVLKCF